MLSVFPWKPAQPRYLIQNLFFLKGYNTTRSVRSKASQIVAEKRCGDCYSWQVWFDQIYVAVVVVVLITFKSSKERDIFALESYRFSLY